MRFAAKTVMCVVVAALLCAQAQSQTAAKPAATPKTSGAGTHAAANSSEHSPANEHGAAFVHPTALSDTQRALHALNRLAFGPRPGDVRAVLAKGLDAWIEDQLHPESIDDSALNARLAPFASTRMNPKLLMQSFPSDGVIRQLIAGKRTVPDDPVLKLVYAVNVARIQQQDAAKNVPPPSALTTAQSGPPPVTPAQEQARATADSLLILPKEQRLAAMENTEPEKLVNFLSLVRPDQRDRLNADATAQEREVMRAFANPASVVAGELQQAKVMRAIYSERQLQEVMTDFWFNHFNVYQYKDQDVYYTTAYERDVIRPRALGKFYDLLVAVAESPAMLVYLDNGASIGPHSQAAGKNGGLNENYGRELMELHTLGVDGGYTQADVTQLAAILSGWTITQPDDGGQFQFDPRRHEPGDEMLLGKRFYDSGQDEGLHALDMLAHAPATARFISKSIATRFVADDPPESLVAHMAEVFQLSDGDIRAVMRAMVQSPEFWSPEAYKAKLKTPLEYVVSTARASGANVVDAGALVGNLSNMGEAPYGMAVPTGYSMKAAQWENEGALLARINFATTLTQGKLGGVQFDPATLVVQGTLKGDDAKTRSAFASKDGSAGLALALCEDAILQGDFSAKDEAVIRKQMDDPDLTRRMASSPIDGLRLIAGFILASPEFQHR
jgi:uncharacterized protein (DUF1800 family)